MLAISSTAKKTVKAANLSTPILKQNDKNLPYWQIRLNTDWQLLTFYD